MKYKTFTVKQIGKTNIKVIEASALDEAVRLLRLAPLSNSHDANCYHVHSYHIDKDTFCENRCSLCIFEKNKQAFLEKVEKK